MNLTCQAQEQLKDTNENVIGLRSVLVNAENPPNQTTVEIYDYVMSNPFTVGNVYVLNIS